MTDMVFRRRRLPHQDVEGHPTFITACLAGSLSAAGLARVRSYRDQLEARSKPEGMSLAEWEHTKQKLLFVVVDELLDGESPVHHLEDDSQAEIVAKAFLHFANERYKLLAFVVMPSHHHWLFLPDEAWSVAAVQQAGSQAGRERTSRDDIPQYSKLHSDDVQSYSGGSRRLLAA